MKYTVGREINFTLIMKPRYNCVLYLPCNIWAKVPTKAVIYNRQNNKMMLYIIGR